jgi:hypothetical protein
VKQVAGFLSSRHRPPVSRSEVLQKLDAWSGVGSQCGNAKPRAEDVVQVFLFRMFSNPLFINLLLTAQSAWRPNTQYFGQRSPFEFAITHCWGLA